MSVILSFVALSVTALPARAAVMYLPQSNLIWMPGILASSLSIDGSNVSLLSHVGPGITGGSFAGVQASFPLVRSEEPRISGWSWGFGAGVTEYLNSNKVFSPSAYYWELMVGRGTTTLLAGGESGLRGYMEFVVRDQAPQHPSETNSFPFEGNSFSFVPRHRRSFVVRTGAGNDIDGKGLVTQHPPKIEFNLQVGLYFELPTKEVKRSFLTIQSHGLMHCGVDWLKCGLGLNYQTSPYAIGTNEESEMATNVALGPTFQALLFSSYLLALDIQWSRMKGYRRAPVLNANGTQKTDSKGQGVTDIFNDYRSSALPGLNLRLSSSF